MKTAFARLLLGAALLPTLLPAQTVTPRQAPPPARWTLAQLQEAFLQADSNGDQQLTRAEAQQLAILPHPFEEMDLNKDGVLSRAEYGLPPA